MVITGGTDGIGRALALAHLERGDNVLVVGRDPEKGKEFGTGFLAADLSLVRENRAVVAEVEARFPELDVLVLCARHYLSARRETAEGFEHNFALFYLSRFLLSHGLSGSLEKAANPVVMNVAGPGADLSAVRWDDLGSTRDYDGAAAMTQAGKLNDLLGVSFAERADRTRYVLFHPGVVATSFSGEYDGPTAAHVEAMKRSATPVETAVWPIVERIDDPPAEPLSAFVRDRRIDVHGVSFDRRAAARLHDRTLELLDGI
ncbi:hypothetical protein GCM10010470_19060 [Saccharopolyspora taberi]|uniref:Oxidoreductase n=1 Tax=Saccharopolyspora taberi TaxID=60895 RepID=A0ABN3V9H3_9PSEU